MDFQLVIDTREKQPYTFACPTLRQALPAGDYSVAGHQGDVAVERKSLPDFVHTVVHDTRRFDAELDKLAVMKSACVVIEADLDRVLRGAHASELRRVAPPALLGAALSIHYRWSVPVFWCGSRPAACHFTEQFLRMYVRTLYGENACPKS